ncbi:MAG TPA: bacteriohemerythrin [Syntrophorhabdaceae bacterium]|nr:bacteriohemerythrin [Syntrophorhabdaceae bacterium]
MPLIKWNDEQMSIHIDEVDRQHRRIADMINELYEAIESKANKELLAQLLIKLVHYTNHHFTTEERYFDRYGYPDASAHKAEHDDLRAKVANLDEDYYKGDRMLTREAMELLNEWVSSHTAVTDKRFGIFVMTRLQAHHLKPAV